MKQPAGSSLHDASLLTLFLLLNYKSMYCQENWRGQKEKKKKNKTNNNMYFKSLIDAFLPSFNWASKQSCHTSHNPSFASLFRAHCKS